MARLIALALVTLAACTSPELDGEAIFQSRVSDGNTFACSTCHAIEEPAADGLRRAGHPIGDAASRPSYKNGQLTSLLAAVNSCLVEWMAADPWRPDDDRWMKLRDWLEELPPAAEAPALTFEIVAPPASVDGGDSVAGHALFNRSCSSCHATDGAGSDLGPPITGFDHDPMFVARRIRTSGLEDSPVYPGLTGGRMPFWSAGRLSDTEVLDLAAYVSSSEPPVGGGGGGPGGGGEGMRECDSTHPRIGQTTQLSTRAHGVRGTARIVDDCTIVLENFSYDGGGIDVRVYGGKAGDYDGGFAISQNFVRMPYSNGTLQVQLPIGKTLDDLDGVSVWCVAASVSFGDGLF